MQVLRFENTGSFDELVLRNISKPSLAPGEALVRVKAAGISLSDAAAVFGILPCVTLPCIPGRGFSGEVAEALDDAGAHADAWIGAHVWGTGSERGFTSDGTFAEFAKILLAALSRKPERLTHVEAASMTLPWFCAWITVDALANVRNDTHVRLMPTGARSAAAQLCNVRGACIFGIYTSLAKVTPPSYMTPIELTSNTAIRDAIAREGLSDKIDVLLDCAGYERPLNDALFTMTPDGSGRVVVMAVYAKNGLFPIDLRTFYTKALTLRGMKSSMLGATEIRTFLDHLSDKIDSGIFLGPSTVATLDIKDVSGVTSALEEILTRSSHVRSVILP